MKDRIREVVQNSKFWIIVSLATIIISIFRPVFDVDNAVNVYITNGLYQSTAQTWNIYSGMLLCYIIGKLHSLFLHINVYTAINWIMMGQQIFIFNYFIRDSVKNQKSKIMIYIVEVAVLGGLLQILNMNFTIQQAFSMCIQMICIDLYNRNGIRYKKYIWLSLQIVYSLYGIQLRVLQGLLIIPWIALTCLINAIHQNKIDLKILVISLLPLLIALVQICQDIVLTSVDTEYREQCLYNKYRSYFFDYDHNADDYVQMQERYTVLDGENGIDLDMARESAEEHSINHFIETFIMNSLYGFADEHQVVVMISLIIILGIKIRIENKLYRLIMLLNNIGTVIVAAVFQLSGKQFPGLDRVNLCILLAYSVTVLILLCHAGQQIKISYNRTVITVAFCALISYCMMQQIYVNVSSRSNILTYKQLYINSIEIDNSNIVYGFLEQVEKRAQLINEGKFVILKQLGQTEQQMIQYKQSSVYSDSIVSKILYGEYIVAIKHEHLDILSILTDRYRRAYPDGPEIRFMCIEDSEGLQYYEVGQK